MTKELNILQTREKKEKGKIIEFELFGKTEFIPTRQFDPTLSHFFGEYVIDNSLKNPEKFNTNVVVGYLIKICPPPEDKIILSLSNQKNNPFYTYTLDVNAIKSSKIINESEFNITKNINQMPDEEIDDLKWGLLSANTLVTISLQNNIKETNSADNIITRLEPLNESIFLKKEILGYICNTSAIKPALGLGISPAYNLSRSGIYNKIYEIPFEIIESLKYRSRLNSDAYL